MRNIDFGGDGGTSAGLDSYVVWAFIYLGPEYTYASLH